MASTQSVFNRNYNSFSGVDIKGVVGNTVIMELQAISYNVTREKAPLYTMGAADPRSFSRGKRGIAGTLITVVFDRHPLISTFGYLQTDPNSQLKFLSDIDDMRPGGDDTNDAFGLPTISASDTSLAGTNTQFESQLVSVASDQEVKAPWFADQIPPFDITLAAANEYGGLAVMRVFGAELLNEGAGVSIDDMMSEMQHTYVARTMVGWKPIKDASIAAQLGQGSTP